MAYMHAHMHMQREKADMAVARPRCTHARASTEFSLNRMLATNSAAA